MNELKNNLIEKIKAGEVNMKPRWHFFLRSLLLLLVFATAALLLVYLISFIFFFMRQTGVGFMPLYGFRGISQFVLSSPWLLIASAGLLLVTLQILIGRYAFSYRHPMVYSIVGIVALALLGSYLIAQSPVHERLRSYNEERPLPLLAPMYRGVEAGRPENVTFGRVVAVTEDGIEIVKRGPERVSVVITPATRQKRGSSYEVGDMVMVFGPQTEGEITALGIRPASRDGRMLERP